MNNKTPAVAEKCINTIRTLSMDAVQKANSGHPGAPMGMAPMGFVLWTEFLRVNPACPDWANRDRFVLSAGHASMLFYSLLHLSGFDLSLDDIKSFRQLNSKTPGHPEYGVTAGVETTTGPLGQGFANGVGMAIAERALAGRFNRPGFELVDHFTYAIVSDGDLMEGISYEAASIAGHMGLGKLIYLYDSNRITIEGPTDLAFSEDVEKRFCACGWHTQVVGDGNRDLEAIAAALAAARAETGRPSIIIVRTSIGFGSPSKQDSEEAHGAPLGADEVRKSKEALGWPADKDFFVPGEVRDFFAQAMKNNAALQEAWQKLFDAYAEKFPEDAAEFRRVIEGRLPAGLGEFSLPFAAGEAKVATRSASGTVLNKIAAFMPELVGGSADLGPSTKTELKGGGDLRSGNPGGRNIRFGIREHAMGAIVNGIALHGGIVPFCSTFFVFADYMRPPMRLAALMGIGPVFVFSHDSIGVGEDGPTHQPIEHLACLRAIPRLNVIRPADANETVYAWRAALERKDGPTALILSRQDLPVLTTAETSAALRRGAYVLKDAESGNPDVILIASGSELSLAMEARAKLAAEGFGVRVVSMPSWELFDAQPKAYKDSVFPPSALKRVAVEAGIRQGWDKYVGACGGFVGLKDFGCSAPGSELFKVLGLTAGAVVACARKIMSEK